MRRLKELFKMIFVVKHKNGRVDKIHGQNEAEVLEVFKISGQEVEIVGKEELPSSPLMKKINQGPPGGMPMPAGMEGMDPIAMAGMVVDRNLAQNPQPGHPGHPGQQSLPQFKPLEFEADGVKFKVEGATVYKKTWVEVTDDSEFRTEDGKIFHLEWVKIK